MPGGADAAWLFGVVATDLVLLGAAYKTAQAPAKVREADDDLSRAYRDGVEARVQPVAERLIEKVLATRRPAQTTQDGVIPAEPIGDALARGAVFNDWQALLDASDDANAARRAAVRWVRWQYSLSGLLFVLALTVIAAAWGPMTGFHVSDGYQAAAIWVAVAAAILTVLAGIVSVLTHNRMQKLITRDRPRLQNP